MSPVSTPLAPSFRSLVAAAFLGLFAIPSIAPGQGQVEKGPIEAQDSRMGTERWIVLFRTRPFDLSAFRQAVYSHASASTVERIVEGLQSAAKAHQAPFFRSAREMGVKKIASWWLINACAIEVPAGAQDTLKALRKLPGVARIERDGIASPSIRTATNSNNHDADSLQAKGIKGSKVTVAILDTGQDSDMSRTGRPHQTYYVDGNIKNTTGGGIGGSRLLVNRKLGKMSADDVHGHGTAVASIAAGAKWSTTTADHGHAYGAQIAGYSIADFSSGSAYYSTIISAWQACARDKVKLKIVAANNSYSGSPDPLHAAQQALDSAAYNADIMVTTSAGNSFGNTKSSQICVNGLSVGAVYENSKNRASFTSFGTTDGQIFPDICANGVGTNMARFDNERSDYVGSGTSMSSPQVCGAAALIRAAAPALTAVETKAILLATTFKSPFAGATQVNTGPGCGYLRDSEAWASATNQKRHGFVTVSYQKPLVKIPIRVQQGKTYQAALAWHRTQLGSRSWSDVNLELKDGSTVLVSSKAGRNTEEFVRFTATKTGVYTLEVSARSVPAGGQRVAWATNADIGGPKPGTYIQYGSGCAGSRTVAVPGTTVFPNAYATKFGNISDGFVFGRANQRYQQILLGSEAPQTMTVTGFSIRQDDVLAGAKGGTHSYTVVLGTTLHTPASLGATFNKNFGGSIKPSTVFQGTVKLPDLSGVNKNPKLFASSVKFSKPWVYTYKAGESILFELRNTSKTSAMQFYDAANGKGVNSTRVLGFTSTASIGAITRNYGYVIRLDSSGGTKRAVPTLAARGVPMIGQSFYVDLGLARANSVAIFALGFSKSSWGAIPLPFELTALGAKGCRILCSLDETIGVATGPKGQAQVLFAVPKIPAFIGIRFFDQFLVLDRAANKLGFSFTNAGEGQIGG